ncbi:MAG TPA: S1C family serine protease [Usitatibacter sp.]|nr:S1C family serine protease [Usitatibacter sp.]
MERQQRRTPIVAAISCAALLAGSVIAAAPPAAPPQPAQSNAAYQHLIDAANAAVTVKSKAIANARSNKTLGDERMGAGVLIAPEGLVLTIGYLILEADEVEITTARGRTLPATVVAYDHATGFGLLRPMGPLDVKPIKLGSSSRVESLDRLMTVGGGGEESVAVATVVSRRAFAGYWEYFLDDAIFTSPPRPDHSGAGLINKEGELVGIGSLFVMDAGTPGERLPGNMFVPIDLLKPILAEMIRTGRQKGGMRPWLGVSSLEEDGRIKVLRVSDDSPAAQAGIAPGDIILSMGGKKIETLPDFYKRLWSAGAPGVEVELKVLHGTEIRDVTLKSIDRAQLFRRKPTI